MSCRGNFPIRAMVTLLLPAILCGCLIHRHQNTPTAAGLNTNNLIEPFGQSTVPASLTSLQNQPVQTISAKRHVLCLSGGGAYGAYSVGIICGWTSRGDRPCFDVVTGISTGALIAPYAFLGSSFDDQIRELYTTVDNRDIYRLRPVTGVFSEAFASIRPLACKLDQAITPPTLAAIAREHSKGRRLYIGTTEMEGHRFVVWDVGAIACRGRAEDVDLVKRILLASTSIPGIFPPVRIPVTVNGQAFTEMHVDGSVSQSVFFLPPTVKSHSQEGNAGQPSTMVFVVVAGKLYADPDSVQPRAVTIARENLEGFGYAHSRGDVYRIWSVCSNHGFGFQLTSIPTSFPAPTSMTQFDREEMTKMYQEGVRQIMSGAAWRSTPPGMGPGEDPLIRSSTDLMHVPRSQQTFGGK